MTVNIHKMLPHDLNISKFAEYLDTIKLLYEVDDDFKSLVDDYLDSKKNFEKFKDQSFETKQLKQEFKRLSHNLEKEILEYVLKRK